MKITIDTKQDSKDEIRKAIKLLYGLLGEDPVYENEPNFEVPKEDGLMNLFEQPKEPKKKLKIMEY